MTTARSLLIIDDDDLSREVLLVLATEYGFRASVASSGAEALESLRVEVPEVILTDLQMPGLSGEALGRTLRAAAGDRVRLIAMSGSGSSAGAGSVFEGFLLKPFSMEELDAMVSGGGAEQRTSEAGRQMLNETIYAGLAQSMTAEQLKALYAMCLEDAERRVRLMYAAATERDGETYVRAAHAVKGGCGMVGATELARLAGAMETEGLPPVGNTAPLGDFLAAAARLRRMLDAQPT